MPRIPLEDNFTDIIQKAQRGFKIDDADLIARAEIRPAELAAVKAGEPIDAIIRRIARHLHLHPLALEILAHHRWYPTTPAFSHGFAIFNTPFEDMTVNSYLLWDRRTKVAAVFDPGPDCTALLDLASAENLRIRYIFVTHTHDDHIADLPRLAAATGAEVWANAREPVDYPGARTFVENAYFHLGELAIKTLDTWGHSPGQTTYYVTGLSWPVAIVGDSLFCSSAGGSADHFPEQLRHVREKILTLPRDTVLGCGHGPLTTVIQERQHNPFFTRG